MEFNADPGPDPGPDPGIIFGIGGDGVCFLDKKLLLISTDSLLIFEAEELEEEVGEVVDEVVCSGVSNQEIPVQASLE